MEKKHKPALVGIYGPLVGETIVLEKPSVGIGRGSDNAIRLKHDSVSRHHCQIQRAGKQFKIVDLNVGPS